MGRRCAGRIDPAIGIKRVLKKTDHQYARVITERRFGTIAMVDIKVNDCHALKSACVERMTRCDGDIIEQENPIDASGVA